MEEPPPEEVPLKEGINAGKHGMCSQCETPVEKDAALGPGQDQMDLLSGHFGSNTPV